jgi:Cu2+-exporting ATPase
VSRCPHCGTPVEGDEDRYCCNGCELAAAIIRGAGLDRYYLEREALPPRPRPLGRGWDTIPVELDPDGTAHVRLMVDGLRCASCVWVTEHVLGAAPGVREATLSYATGRATLRWDPEKTDLPELAGRIATLGYRPRILGEDGPRDRDLLTRLGVAVFAAANVMLMSVSIYAGWFSSMEERFVVLFQWASLVLATPVALWAAGPFFSGAWSGLRHGVLHMDLPIAIAVTVLYGHGLVVTVIGSGDAYLDSLTMLVALLLAGRVLESGGRRRSAEAAVSLAAGVPASARRHDGDRVESVPSSELEAGDRIDVGAGEELAADGVVETGRGLVRMALVTGEADPVAVGVGSRVVAGTILEEGSVTVLVERAGKDTLLARMADELRVAADRGVRPGVSDRIAPWFTGLTLAVALATFLWWLATSGLGQALTTTVAVLVVACPCALALSRPLAAAAGLGATARRGLLLRSADALLELGEMDLAALDKTGTVTEGEPVIVEADDRVLRIAAGLERYSGHPIARAIVSEAVRRGIPLPQAQDVEEEPGQGISGWVDGARWSLRAGTGGEVLLQAEPGAGEGSAPRADAARGPTGGALHLGDRPREDSRLAVQALRDEGLSVVLLTGDHEAAARRIGEAAGPDEVHARLTPEGKADWIRDRQEAGRKVLFVGDGLNDGPALAVADVGLAMGSGSASSLLVADGVLSSASLLPVASGIRAARACRRAIRGNQIRSIAYNVSAVAAAAAGYINPLVAAVLMPMSSALVIWGASRVERRVDRLEGE